MGGPVVAVTGRAVTRRIDGLGDAHRAEHVTRSVRGAEKRVASATRRAVTLGDRRRIATRRKIAARLLLIAWLLLIARLRLVCRRLLITRLWLIAGLLLVIRRRLIAIQLLLIVATGRRRLVVLGVRLTAREAEKHGADGETAIHPRFLNPIDQGYAAPRLLVADRPPPGL